MDWWWESERDSGSRARRQEGFELLADDAVPGECAEHVTAQPGGGRIDGTEYGGRKRRRAGGCRHEGRAIGRHFAERRQVGADDRYAEDGGFGEGQAEALAGAGEDHDIAQHIKVGKRGRIDRVVAARPRALFEEEADRLLKAEALRLAVQVGDLVQRARIV